MEKKNRGKNQSQTAEKRDPAAARAAETGVLTDSRRAPSPFELFFEAKMEELTGEGELSLLVALSGGADSSALLLLAARMRDRRGGIVEAAHVHHGIRGEEADRDAAASEALCARLGVPFHLVKVNVPSIAAQNAMGLEEAARAERYKALGHVRAKRGLRFIATAHNAEDQLETMIFQLCRGCSLRGLSAIREKGGVILRPLLSFRRAELEDYCAQNGVEYVYDSSNSDERFARNRIRRRVLPHLLEICPGAPDAAVRLARSLREDEELLEDLVPRGEDLTLTALQALPSPILRRWLVSEYELCAEGAGTLQSAHLAALERLVREGQTGKAVCLPGRITAERTKDRIRFHKTAPKNESGADRAQRIALKPGKNEIPGTNWTVWVTDAQTFDEYCAKNQKIHTLFTKVALNSATISSDLYLRRRLPRDRIVFGGMTREVSKLAAAKTGDPVLRRSYPVICDGAGILWVPGYPPRDGTGPAGKSGCTYILMEGLT